MLCTWPKVLTWDEAVNEWKQLEANPKGLNVFSCKVGGELYIRIATEIDMNLRNTSERTNEVDATIRQIKAPSEDQIKDEMSKLGLGLDVFGKVDFDMLSDMKGVLKNSGGGNLNAFADVAQTIPDIKALIEASDDDAAAGDDEDDEGECEDLEGDSEGEGDEADPKRRKGPQGEKAEKWWPRAAFLVDKERQVEALILASEDSVKVVLKDLEKICDEVERGSITMK